VIFTTMSSLMCNTATGVVSAPRKSENISATIFWLYFRTKSFPASGGTRSVHLRTSNFRLPAMLQAGALSCHTSLPDSRFRQTVCTKMAEAGVGEGTMLDIMGHMSAAMLRPHSRRLTH
jgi:hypothetical protein